MIRGARAEVALDAGTYNSDTNTVYWGTPSGAAL